MNASERLDELLLKFAKDLRAIDGYRLLRHITVEEESKQRAAEHLAAKQSILKLIDEAKIEELSELSRKSERHESDGICNTEFYISTDYIHERLAELKAKEGKK